MSTNYRKRRIAKEGIIRHKYPHGLWDKKYY
jgi:hypothetical protein